MAAQEVVNAIFRAARAGSTGELVRLLDAQPHLLEVTSWERRTLLSEATERGHTDMVRVLLGRGADVNASASDGWTPLHEAAVRDREEVVSILLSSGADTSRKDRHGWTALYLASLHGRLGVARQLLQHAPACELDERTNDSRTALWAACGCGRVRVARALLLAGTDYTITSNDGRTPRQAAEEGGHTRCVSLLKWWEGELERGYVVHRARHLAEQHSLLQPTLAAAAACLTSVSIPAFLSPRAIVSPLPHVEVVRLSEEKGTGACAGQGKRKVEEEEGPPEEERDAMLKYVIQDLHPELYIELLAGFHALRDPGT